MKGNDMNPDFYDTSRESLTVIRDGDKIRLRLGAVAYVDLTEDQAVRVVSLMLAAINDRT